MFFWMTSTSRGSVISRWRVIQFRSGRMILILFVVLPGDTQLLNMQSEGSCRRRQTSTASECWFLRSSAVGRTQISTYHLSSSTFKPIGMYIYAFALE
ncbi:hypothetical protein LINPERPRIM_LOCUS28921 [Linum perenne]